MSDDAQLIRQYVDERSDEAFRQIVRSHAGLVYSAARRLLQGDAHRADDVTQEVFVALARKAPGLRRHPTLTGWLYTVTHFKVSEIIRSERRRQAREQEAQAMQETMSSDDPGWDRLGPVLDEVMLELNDRDREALLLRYFEGRGFAEIGARHAVTESAAQKRVDRAIEKLRARFARRGMTSSAAALGALLSANAAETVPGGLIAAASTAGLSAGSVAAGGFWSALFAGSIPIMTTANKTAAILAALSLAANAALLGTISTHPGILSRRGSGTDASGGTAAPVPAAAMPGPAVAAADGGLNLTPEQWHALRATDLPTQVARLRAMGLPPDVVAALVWPQIWEKFEGRMKELYGADKPLAPYWEPEARASNYLLAQGRGRAEQALLVDLLKEMQAAMGTEAWRLIPPPLLAEFQREYGGLAVEKVTALLMLQGEFAMKREEVRGRTGDVFLPSDDEEVDRIEAGLKEAISRLLSPEELHEFELRNSPSTMRLRERLAGFTPSEQEFRAILPLHEKFEKEHGTEIPSPTAVAERARWQAAQAQLREDVAAVLTPERANDYRFGMQFGMLARLATRLELPMARVRELQALQQRTNQAAGAIRNNPALDPAVASQQLAQLGDSMRTEGTAILGNPAAFELYRLNAVQGIATLFTNPASGLRAPAAPTPAPASAP